MRKRIGAVALTLSLAAAGLFSGFYSQNVRAADTQSSDTSAESATEETTDEEDVIDESDTVFDEIGIDTSEVPDDYDEDSEENPNGAEYKTMVSVGEIFSVSDNGAILYGHDNEFDDNYDTFIGTQNTASTMGTVSGAYRASASGCFDGKGRKSDIAIATLSSDGTLTLSMTGKNNDNFAPMSSPMYVTSGIDMSGSYNKQNLVEITTGDFNGDGMDEIALITPQTSENDANAKVLVYRLKGSGLNPYNIANWSMVWSYTLPKSSTYWNIYDLCASDVNGDATDDLIVSWGKVTLANGATATSAKLDGDNTQKSSSVLLLGGKTKMLQTESDISYGDEPLCRVAFTAGDIDGDGAKEIVLGGQILNEARDNNQTRCLALYTYDSATGKLVTNSVIDKKVVENGNGYDTQYLSMPDMKANITVASIYGTTNDTCVYLDSVLYTYSSSSSFQIADELDDADTKNSDQITIKHPFYGSSVYSEYNANGSKFAGGTSEGILVERIKSGSFKTADLLYEKYASGKNSDKKEDLTVLRYDTGYNSTGAADGSFATLADTDEDSTVMRYTGNHYLLYSDPTILAVMASSPYFKDVAENADGGDDMVGSCGTSFGQSKGTESYDGIDFSVNIGYHHEFSIKWLANSPFNFTWNFDIGVSAGSTDTNSVEKEFTVTYSSIAGTDCVALYSIPEAIYEYEVEYIDAEGNKQTKKVSVDIPYQPVTQTITLETYNKIQQNYKDRLPEIDGKAITSTVGDPSSYPSSASGYKNAEVYDGSWAGTAYNSEGSVSQEISISSGHTFEETVGGYLSNTIMTGTELFKAGGSVDVSMVHISGSVNSKGVTANGTVANMPEEAEPYGYYFAWKLMIYDYQVNDDSSFPVVTYLTRDVTTPPALPEDFSQDMENTTDSQIGLSWTYSDSATSFDIYRKSKFSDGESNVKIGTVKASDYTLQKDSDGAIAYDEDGNVVKEYSFIDEDRSPYTEYEYSIQVNRSKAPAQSIPSASLKARTNAKYQPQVKISDEELTLYPDTVKTVTATALDSDEFTYNNKSYQWQKYDKKTDSWTDIAGKTSSKYKFVNCDAEVEGEYRCRLNTEISAGEAVYNLSVYTKTLTVDFSKRDVQFGDVTYTEDGDSVTFTLGITNIGDGTKSQPSGAIMFTLSDGENETIKYSSIDVSKNTATVTFTDLSSGAYELSSEYFGQSSIFKDRKNEDTFVYMKDINSGTWISSQTTYKFHENILDSLKLYSLNVGSNGQTVKTDISDEIHKIEIYTPGSILCASYDITEDNKIAFIPAGEDENCQQIASSKSAVLKIYYGDDNEFVMKTVSAQKAKITLYLDDIESSNNSDLNKISLNDVKVKGDGYEDGESVFTYNKDHSLTDIPSVFEDGTSHFNIGLYTTSGDLMGNLYDTTVSGEEKPDSSTVLSGKYVLKVRCGDDYDSWGTLSYFYDITLDSSSFVLYGDTYTINAKAGMNNGETVGSVTLVSPDQTDDVTGMKYQGGTTLTFKAIPVSEYYVESWQIQESGETRVVPATSDKLAYTVQGTSSTINITAIFALKENHFAYKVIGGGTLECTNATLSEDSIVISGRELKFTATADDGYEFVEWRKVTVGQSTAVSKGTVSDDGKTSTNTFTMGSASTVLYAVFQRQKADITLSDHLVAYYLNSSDIDSNVPDGLELKVNNDNKVAKGATVIIRPEAGYKVSNWNVTGVAAENIEKIEGDTAIQFVVPDDADSIDVNATAVAGVYSLSIKSESTETSTESSNSVASLSITLNKSAVSVDSDDLDQVTAGTSLEVTVTPKRGYAFDHWKVNNKDIDGDNLVYATNVIKNMKIVAICKPISSYTLKNQLIFSGTYGGEEEKVLCEIYNSYGEKVADYSYNKNITYDTTLPTIYEGESIKYTVENGNFNRMEINGKTVKDLTTKYQITDIDSDQEVLLYFMPSIYYKVNIQNDTGYSLYENASSEGHFNTLISTSMYCYPTELYPIYIVDSEGDTHIFDVHVYLNGKELSYVNDHYALSNINCESTLVITKTKTYHIQTQDDLKEYLHALPTTADSDGNYKAVNAVLDNDITLSDDATDMVLDGSVLAGTFDGNGHTIYNFQTTSCCKGIFTKIAKDGIVKNLRLNGTNLRIGTEVDIYGGTIASENEGTIEDCSVESSYLRALAESHMGSIVGKNAGTIKNCLVNECKYNKGASGRGDYGFIASLNTGEISTSYVRHIAVYGSTAGEYVKSDAIVAAETVSASTGTISDCYYDQGYVSDAEKVIGHGTSMWNSETESISFEKAAWKMNRANTDEEMVWGIYASNTQYPVLLNLEEEGENEAKAPVMLSFTNYQDYYIYPGSFTLPSKEESGAEAWSDGTTCYSAEKVIESVTKDTTFTKADLKNEYIISVMASDGDQSAYYFKTIKEALAYANEKAADSDASLIVSVNKDVSLEESIVVGNGVLLTLNAENNVTFTIEDGASLTNRGAIKLPAGSKIYNYGTFKNAEDASLDIGTTESPAGTFTNSGAFDNAGSISEQTLIICEPHSWSDKVVTKQSSSDEEGEMTQTCKACLKTRTYTIPKNDPDPDQNKVEKIEISNPDITSYIVTADSDDTSSTTDQDVVFDATGIKAVAELTDGSTATVTNLTYSINGHAISSGDSLKDFLDTYKICDTKGFVLTITAADYSGTEGAEQTCDLTFSGTAVGHQYRFVAAVTATITKDGSKAHYVCDRCGKYFTADKKTETTLKDLIITKESVIEKKEADEIAGQPKQIQYVAGKYGVSKATLAVTESSLTKRKTDTDVAGSAYAKVALRASKVSKNSIKIKWSKVTGADGYMIFGNLCGNKYQMKKLKTVSKNTTTYTQTKLKAGKYYKYSIIAYKLVGTKKVTLSVSKTIHVATSGGKYGRITGITVKKVGSSKKKAATLKVKKTAKISAKEKYTKKLARHRKLSYESSNTKIATVSSTGKIKAVKKGKCYIYIYAQNGVYTRITVTVK